MENHWPFRLITPWTTVHASEESLLGTQLERTRTAPSIPVAGGRGEAATEDLGGAVRRSGVQEPELCPVCGMLRPATLHGKWVGVRGYFRPSNRQCREEYISIESKI